MKISILDQSPISDYMTAKDALDATIELAIHAEKLGYERFWVAEHHDLFGLASSNPAVLISAIGARTSRIKLGAGAVLLPYYKPYFVAETYNLLATLYPGRIDLGLGRAPGGSAEVSLALSENYLKEVRYFPEKIDELKHFFNRDFSAEHIFHKINPTPIPAERVPTYLLGTSEKSAILAAEKQLPYAFGHFMTDGNGPQIAKKYRSEYKHESEKPYVIVALEVVCAETDEKAEELALSSIAWKLKQNDIEAKQQIVPIEEAYKIVLGNEEKVLKIKEKMIIGSPKTVSDKLKKIEAEYEADELMIVTIVHSPEDKKKSYEHIARMID